LPSLPAKRQLTIIVTTLHLQKQGTIVSAVVATMFQWPQLPNAPWTAKGALLIALSFGVISVIMALQQTFFLNELSFHTDPIEQARRITGGGPPVAADGNSAGYSTTLQVRFSAALIWHLPHMALGSSIYALIIGLTIVVVHPGVMAERSDDEWKVNQIPNGCYHLLPLSLLLLQVEKLCRTK
jgi:hypothetical protein